MRPPRLLAQRKLESLELVSVAAVDEALGVNVVIFVRCAVDEVQEPHEYKPVNSKPKVRRDSIDPAHFREPVSHWAWWPSWAAALPT